MAARARFLMEVPVPVPARCRAFGKRKREVVTDQPDGSRWRAHEVAGGGERRETLVERGVADAACGAQLGERDRPGGIGEGACDAFVHRGGRRVSRRRTLDHFQREGVATLGELERHRGARRLRRDARR